MRNANKIQTRRMRGIVFIALLLSASTAIFGQVDTAADTNSELFNYYMLEHKPLFGGATNQEQSEKLLYEFVAEKLEALNLEKGLKAYITFEIDVYGKVQNAVVVNGKDKMFNEIALKIVKELPKWKPASKDLVLVRSSFTLEVKT